MRRLIFVLVGLLSYAHLLRAKDQNSVIFTANRWGEKKYKIFSFDTVKRNGCKNAASLVR